MATVPQGATAGHGVVNLVNVKFTSVGSSVYLNTIWNLSTTAELKPLVYARYVDMPGGYSTWCGATPTGHYMRLYEQSVFCNSPRFAYQINVSMLNSDHSSNSGTHGTSQYPTGFAPVPTSSPSGNILRVGPTRSYTTVAAAYNAAGHGDDIIIDAGTYDCSVFHRATGGIQLMKMVRFWGATEDPDDVILYNDGSCVYGCHFFHWRPYSMTNVPVEYRAPGFFHVTLQRPSDDTWESTHDVMRVDSEVDNNPWVPPTPILTNAIMFSCNT